MKPTIVCLCGSTRFPDLFAHANATETNAGKIVLSVGRFGHMDGLDMDGPQKQMLDELHLRKIDLADEILVIAPPCQTCPTCGRIRRCLDPFVEKRHCTCGMDLTGVQVTPYIGESTSREIAYAKKHNKIIRYYLKADYEHITHG